MTAIFLASDHAGCKLKAEVAAYLTQAGHEVTDLGTDGSASVAVSYTHLRAHET